MHTAAARNSGKTDTGAGSGKMSGASRTALARRSAYEPSTFLERGTIVPFTTESLLQCRVRLDDRKRLEVVLPGFSGSTGIYVTTWTSLPELVTLSVHDRALTAMVTEQMAVTPVDIHECWLKLAMTGIGGQDLADQARADLARSESTRLASRVFLLLDTIRRAGGDLSSDMIARITTPDSDRSVRQILIDAAQRIQSDPSTVEARIGQLADSVGTLGLKSLPDKGRLRELHWRLREFSHAIGTWARTTVADIAPMGRFAAMSADHTIDIAGRSIAKVDRMLSNPLTLLQQWESSSRKLDDECLRIAWLLDGWDYVLQIWNDAVSERVPVDIAVREIGRIIPIVPVNEADPEAAGRSAELFTEFRTKVRIYEDWLSGDINLEMARPRNRGRAS